MKNNAFLALFSLISLIPGCMQIGKKPITRHLHVTKKHVAPLPLQTAIDIQEAQSCPPAVTIWVHGTRFFPEGVLDTYFFSLSGLNHYTSIDAKYHQRRLAETLIAADPEHFNAEHFYLFGWNGALSFKEREKAAFNLYENLKIIRQNYKKKYGCEPYIRMLAHSHGGNVILLLAQVKAPEDADFLVNQVILMGTPVQKQTKNYACADCFGKVYSFYSMLDVLQVIDPQGLRQKETRFFSERLFPAHEKIEQVAIKYNTRSLMHIEFVKRKFIAQIPSVLAEIDSWKESSSLPTHEWAQKDKCLSLNMKRSNRA